MLLSLTYSSTVAVSSLASLSSTAKKLTVTYLVDEGSRLRDHDVILEEPEEEEQEERIRECERFGNILGPRFRSSSHYFGTCRRTLCCNIYLKTAVYSLRVQE
jgi:hypothetical protein